MPNIALHRPGIEPGPPLIECGRSTIELWNLYIIWVCLSADRQGGVKSYVTISPPTHQQASMYTYTIEGGGGALPASPLPLNTCSHNTATRRPPHPSNTHQHTTTHKNTQQQTTTHNNSTQQYTTALGYIKLPMSRWGQFKGSKKSWPPQNVPRNGS